MATKPESEKLDFAKIDRKWQEKWEKAKIFEAKEGKGEKFYLVEMYPYPSASGLHMGHAFNYTIGDVLARFKRMIGFNVLHPMGFDSFGLPAENAAIKAKEHPKPFTEKAIANFIRQQKALGITYDWTRKLQSHDSEYYKWNQYFFLRLMEKGLVYRKKSPVNWCSKCDTVLANEQVHNGKCWRHEDTDVEIKHLEQWFIKTTDYAEELLKGIAKLDWPERIKIMQENWIGRSEGTEIDFEINGKKWPVFTTRPDTLFGVTFLVVSAQHTELMSVVASEQKKEVEKFLKRIKSTSEKDAIDLDKEGVFTGSYAIHPLTGEKIPVWAGNFVVADYGSGMVMAVPAHDKRDFEFAKKYGIPMVRVIAKKDVSIRSFLMGASKITDDELKELGIKILNKTDGLDRAIEIPAKSIELYEELIKKKLDKGFWNEYLSKEIVFIFKHKGGETERLVLNRKNHDKINKLSAEFTNESVGKTNVWAWLADNKFYTDLIVHTGAGDLVNSEGFNGLFSEEAKEHITKALEAKKLGKKVVNYKLRDWLVSRQRYWGTPIPVVYCDRCGIQGVLEKDLPVLLPEKVEFGEGNPLATNDKFVNTKCPKCGSKGRRETDTMDTFFDSSWYYLKYCDAKNKKKPFDKKKVEFWMPVDFYTGGAEHACMHLIYARFFTKALRDMGFVNFDEPFTKLFNQGMVHGEDGSVMSKSKGNVVDPLEITEKQGADALRLFLVSVASPDKDFAWSGTGLEGSTRFLNKVVEYASNVKFGKSSKKVEHKVNSAIKAVGNYIEELKYNFAVIKLRALVDSLEFEIAKKDYISVVKLLSPFCPHIAEELWSRISGKGFVSVSEWPVVDESKIDESFDRIDEANEKIISDILNIVRIVKEKQNKDVERVYVYAIPNELENYNSEEIGKRVGKKVEVFAVNDKKKHDPTNKSKNSKPGKPAIFVE